MEDRNNEPLVTLNKVLGMILAVFGILSVFFLIWGMWLPMKVCFTVVFLAVIAVMVTPEGV